MIDYSQWLESVKMGHDGLIPLLIVFVLAIMGTIALNFMSDSIGDTRFGVSAVLTSTLLLVFIIVGILVKFCLPPEGHALVRAEDGTGVRSGTDRLRLRLSCLWTAGRPHFGKLDAGWETCSRHDHRGRT